MGSGRTANPFRPAGGRASLLTTLRAGVGWGASREPRRVAPRAPTRPGWLIWRVPMAAARSLPDRLTLLNAALLLLVAAAAWIGGVVQSASMTDMGAATMSGAAMQDAE